MRLDSINVRNKEYNVGGTFATMSDCYFENNMLTIYQESAGIWHDAKLLESVIGSFGAPKLSQPLVEQKPPYPSY